MLMLMVMLMLMRVFECQLRNKAGVSMKLWEKKLETQKLWYRAFPPPAETIQAPTPAPTAFNDERVREIDALSELRNAFGGSVSGASGYMLLYRAVESPAHARCGVAQPEPVCELPASLL